MWTSSLSLVAVINKKGGNIRIYVDFGMTVNKAVEFQYYPLRTVEEIFASIAEEKAFTVLDLSGAYQPLVVIRPMREFLTINTLFGLLSYSFGIASAPELFQSIMKSILAEWGGSVLPFR